MDCVGDRDFALTFDDGPSTVTPDLLNTLAAFNVKATFFVVGSMVQIKCVRVCLRLSVLHPSVC